MAASALTLRTIYGGALAPIDKVKELLAEEMDVSKIRDFAKAVEAAKKVDGENLVRKNYWGELSLFSARRLGELIKQGQSEGTIAAKGSKKEISHDAILTLEDIGVDKDQSSRAQKMAEIPEEKLTEYIEEQKQAGEEITKAGAIRFANGLSKSGDRFQTATGTCEWYTPPAYVETARDLMSGIDIDPATRDIAQKRIRAKRFHTIEDDGLSHVWRGRVWLNPPYAAGLVDKFTAKLCEHVDSGDVTQAVVLVNNSTETGWFQELATRASAICFPKSRIRFFDEKWELRDSPLQGQAFLYFGDRVKSFCELFGEFGICFQGGQHVAAV